MPDRLDTSVSCFVVKIWGGKEATYQLLIEWKVCLDGLKYLGQQVTEAAVPSGSLLYINLFSLPVGSSDSTFKDCLLN